MIGLTEITQNEYETLLKSSGEEKNREFLSGTWARLYSKDRTRAFNLIKNGSGNRFYIQEVFETADKISEVSQKDVDNLINQVST